MFGLIAEEKNEEELNSCHSARSSRIHNQIRMDPVTSCRMTVMVRNSRTKTLVMPLQNGTQKKKAGSRTFVGMTVRVRMTAGWLKPLITADRLVRGKKDKVLNFFRQTFLAIIDNCFVGYFLFDEVNKIC